MWIYKSKKYKWVKSINYRIYKWFFYLYGRVVGNGEMFDKL